jgi:hypothetical protein
MLMIRDTNAAMLPTHVRTRRRHSRRTVRVRDAEVAAIAELRDALTASDVARQSRSRIRGLEVEEHQ